MAKATGKMGIGNLAVGCDGNVVTLELLTYHRGRPYALFTTGEIDSLIKVLKSYQAKAKAPPPTDDDDDWSDLV